MAPPSLQCPVCKTSITWSDDYPHRPFCGKRCKLIDLGDWATEAHSIPSSPSYGDDIYSDDLQEDR